jgi:hypothetical protein
MRPRPKVRQEYSDLLQIHFMNSAASTLLQTLSMVGVRSVRFRMLSQRDCTKHTTPVALWDKETGEHRLPRFSVESLFEAYALTPKRGLYTLEVEGGSLSFTPPRPRAIAGAETRAENPADDKRWTPKISRRRERMKSGPLQKFPSA